MRTYRRDESLDKSTDLHWATLNTGTLRPSRSAMVCITCQQFRHALSEDGTTIPACTRHERLLPQGSHLNHRCHQWMQRLEHEIGWGPEAA